jgi:hypothetical protein
MHLAYRDSEMTRWHKHRTGLDQVSAMLRLEQQHQGSWQADLVAGAAALFNAWMQASEEWLRRL